MVRKVEAEELQSLNRGRQEIKEKKVLKGGLIVGTGYLKNSIYKIISYSKRSPGKQDQSSPQSP